MSSFPSTSHFATAVRDLPRSLPYTRLFGTHLVVDEEVCCSHRATGRERELTPR